MCSQAVGVESGWRGVCVVKYAQPQKRVDYRCKTLSGDGSKGAVCLIAYNKVLLLERVVIIRDVQMSMI